MRSMLILVAAAMLCSPLGGCVALVASWPAIGDDTAVNDPNVSPMPKVIAAGVRDVMAKYPARGPYVLNLPEGLEKFRAERIAREIGPNAQVVTAENQNLPVYHVTRVWIRGDRAEVDIVRPMDEPKTWQRITAYLRYHSFDGGWRSAYLKVWPLGMATPGSLYGWLDAGAIGDPPPPGVAAPTSPPPSADPPSQSQSDQFPDQGLVQTIEVKEKADDGSGN